MYNKPEEEQHVEQQVQQMAREQVEVEEKEFEHHSKCNVKDQLIRPPQKKNRKKRNQTYTM
jgi:hypothetical protein